MIKRVFTKHPVGGKLRGVPATVLPGVLTKNGINARIKRKRNGGRGSCAVGCLYAVYAKNVFEGLLRNYFVALVFLLAVCLNAYGFERNASPFHAVQSSGIAHVNIHFGQNYRVVANIPEDLEQYLVLTVKNDTLFVETRSGQYSPVEFLVDVYMPSVASVTLSGTGNVVLDRGKGANLTVTNNGVGSFDGSRYQTDRATVSTSGGNIRIWAADVLDATVFGVGSVYYYGDPEIKRNSFGLGKIMKG